jgi:hypothetical protein
MSNASAKDDASLLRPQILSGPAVVRDDSIKDLNHSPTPDEEVWYKNSLAQDAEISASEVEFFKVLRSQKKD